MDLLHHVSAISLFVEDLAATKAFYHRVFAAPVIYEDASSVALRFGDLIVNLLQADGAGEIVAPAAVGDATAGARFQLSIWVEDVAAVAAVLRREAVKFTGPIDRSWGLRTINFVDPAGHNWEVGQKLGP